jgi:hypothetical protein
MPGMDGVVRGRLGAPAVGRPLDRLAWVHAVSTCGDALVAVALAGTLFFAVPVAAARPRVALYLLLTVAPFAVVAPLLGRLLDGRSGAGRLALAAAMALRAALAALAVSRTQSLLLYPLAFGLLQIPGPDVGPAAGTRFQDHRRTALAAALQIQVPPADVDEAGEVAARRRGRRRRGSGLGEARDRHGKHQDDQGDDGNPVHSDSPLVQPT